MNYETKFAEALGSLPTTKNEKTASALSVMTIEELDSIASGDGSSFIDEAVEEILAIEKVAMADQWGRELARSGIEKDAFIARAFGKLVGAAERAPGAFKNLRNAAATRAGQAAESVKAAPTKAKEFLKKDWEATVQHFQAGRAGKAAPNVGMGGKPITPPASAATAANKAQAAKPATSKPSFWDRHGNKVMAGGVGAAGLAGGAYMVNNGSQGGGAAGPEMPKTGSVLRLEAALEKMSAPAMGLLQKGVGNVAGKILTTGAGARTAVGAGLGAAAGLAKDPGYDAQGNQQSRIGNALGGAAIGAGLGLGAKGAVKSIGSMNNGVGRYVGGAVKQVGKQQGHMGMYVQGQNMQKARIARAQASRAARPTAAPAAGPIPGGGFSD